MDYRKLFDAEDESVRERYALAMERIRVRTSCQRAV